MHTAFYTIILLYFCCITLVNILGNSLVLLAIKTTESLRNKTNYFLVSLACVDLTFGLFSIPIWVPVQAVYHGFGGNVTDNSHWENACITAAFGYSIGAIGEGLAVLLVALDRFIYVVYPLKYHFIITDERTHRLIVGKWVVTVISAVTVTFYPNDSLRIKEIGCFPSAIYDSAINTYFACPFLTIVTVVMCILYGKIAWVAHKKSRIGTDLEVGPKELNQERMQQSKQLKITRTITPIIGIYLTTGVVYSVTLVSSLYVDSDKAFTLEYLGIAISHLNHWTNFLIYTFR